MNGPHPVHSGARARTRAARADDRLDRAGTDLAEPPHWYAQERISRCRGLGYCVIEVHEFDPRAGSGPPRVAYRVYREARGFPVGEFVARFDTLEAARRHAEALGVAASPRGPRPARDERA